ncbi:MAG: bifunctional DNA primase/polymerase [Porphyrobacter sp.]|nr:bifunctional DNA primase/polymerase [Porphyrobacter sp.]
MITDNKVHSDRFSAAVEAGFRVFPVMPGDKIPALAWKGFVERAATIEEILAWESNDFNVGVICGQPSGIAVLDVDSVEAQEFVDGLDLPLTPVVSTGKGHHYYFKVPAGVELRNRTGIAGQKLDLRAEGGYVVGAGSKHSSGRLYEWLVSPADVPFADFPPQLLQLASSSGRLSIPTRATDSPSERIVATRFDWYLERSLGEALKAIRSAEEGKRNDALFLAGVRFASEVAGAGASWPNYTPTLRAAAMAIGLEESETNATLASCWNSGSADPSPWMVTAQDWIFLGKQNVFYHLESGEHMKVDAFNNMFGGQRVTKCPLHRFLLDNEFVIKVQDLTYLPGNSDLFVERDGMIWHNTYRDSGIAPVEGDWSPFEDFLNYLVPEEEERAHLLRMIAWTVRNPGQKLRHALLFRSDEQGIGKSMLSEIWGALLGRRNVKKTSTEEINSDYQGFLQETLLIVVEELNRGVGPMVYNRMKDWITGDVVRVNEKFLVRREWPNTATFVMFTNLKTPMIIEDRDRRIMYIDSSAKRLKPEYYRNFASWWRGNLGVIRAFIDTVDLADFNPHAPPPMTASKQALIADGREDLVKDLLLAIEERSGPFNRDIVTLAEIEAVLGNSFRGKTKTQLYAALRSIGAVSFKQQRVTGRWNFSHFVDANGHRESLWAIRNTRYWALSDPQARAEEFRRIESTFAHLDGVPIEVRHMSEWPGS